MRYHHFQRADAARTALQPIRAAFLIIQLEDVMAGPVLRVQRFFVQIRIF
jgi:hypothetical protein